MAKINLTPPALTKQEIARFWSYVDKRRGQGPKGDCWEWTRGKSGSHYGYHQVGQRLFRTSRLAFWIATRHWPNLQVLHSCDNPPCCNPSHLSAGTQQENAHDAMRKGRLATGDRNGSRMYPERLQRGAERPCSKLTPAIVLEIRAKYTNGNQSYRSLAKEHHVSNRLIGNIIRREAWAHV